MMSKFQSGKKVGEDSGNAKLLHDIEAINKKLYLDKARPRSSIPTLSSLSKSVAKNQLPKPKSKEKQNTDDSLPKEKKSIWSWKSLKSLTHVPNRKFNCCFSLQVHSIEGLPLYFDDRSVCVYWKRRDGGLNTRPTKVSKGIVEFEEQLTHTCSVYGSRSGPHHSAKYEAKHFLLYASLHGSPELDLGKHRVDLSRLLPLTLEELEDDKSSSKWTTSFGLSGMAKGATMHVSFGYMVVGNLRPNSANIVKPGGEFGRIENRSSIRRSGSLPSRSHASSLSVEDIKDLHEVLPISKSELVDSVNMLYLKFEEEKLSMEVDYKPELDVFSEPLEPLKPNSYFSDTAKDHVENECEVSEFSVVDQGIEMSSIELVKSEVGITNRADGSVIESLDLPKTDSPVVVAHEEDTELHPPVKESESPRDELVVKHCNVEEFDFPKIDSPVVLAHIDEPVMNECNAKEDDLCENELLIKELESALNSMSDLMNEGSDSQETEIRVSKDKSHFEKGRRGKSLSLDYATESVASDFLDMLGIEHSPFGLSSESDSESPRERLLRQFERDTLASGYSLLNFDIDEDPHEFGFDASCGSQCGMISEELDHSSVVQDFEETCKTEAQALKGKTKALELEDLETETLMREWGLNEDAFHSSPPNSAHGFGSPIDLPPEQPLQLPPLGEGLGPFVQTSNGGFLRSMSPAIFDKAKSKGSLIMQVSSPVVVPAEMGSGIMEILQRLASVGIEKLSMQANKLMPLEDITGKTIEQIAWEAAPSLEAPERHDLLQQESKVGQNTFGVQKRTRGKPSGSKSSKFDSSSSGKKEMDSEYVSLEDLAPLAMDKIEALSIEGLKIQSDMSDEDPPSNISPQSTGGAINLEGAGGLQLLNIKDSGDDVDGLMGLSLTLDEWMRLDSGEIDGGDQISERTSKILAAHHASDSMRERLNGEKKRGKGSRKCGLLGNNFTVALMVQLRDPLRNYEPVGAPMLGLIQVERVFVPPKPKIYNTVSEVRCNNTEDDDEIEPMKKVVKEEILEKIEQEESVAQFKITEVHVAGFKAEPTGKKKLWGSKTQQQSGSRWLVANGMGKNNKHPLMKSKAAAKSSAPANTSTTTVQPGETLWSISSRVHGTGSKWKELAKLNPHIRNPNVIFPNETIRLC